MDARSAIENSLYRYALLYEIDDFAEISECMTDDVQVEFSTGVKRGRTAVTEELLRRRAKYRIDSSTPRHIITNVVIIHDTPHTAHVTSAFALYVKPNDGAPKLINIGSYSDLFVEDGSSWKISARRFMLL